jgi:hypothetical protein
MEPTTRNRLRLAGTAGVIVVFILSFIVLHPDVSITDSKGVPPPCR